MDCLPLNEHSDIEKILANLEKVSVMICFANYSIVGQTYYQAEQRFLDMLNKDIMLGKQRLTELLIVTKALLFNPGGEKEQITSPCFVRKDSIVFIGTLGETRSTTSEKINAVKTYPWTKKDIVSAKMVIAGKYRLVGQIHGDPWVLPVHSIESQNRFLPMTNVRVISALEPSEISFDFVALNRNHVSLFQLS